MGNVYAQCTADNCKTKHPRAFTNMNHAKKETFTQPLSKVTSIITTADPVVRKPENDVSHVTHENTSSGGSDLHHHHHHQEGKSPDSHQDKPHSSSSPFISPSASLDNSSDNHPIKPSHCILPPLVAHDLVTKTKKRLEHILEKSPFLAANRRAITRVPTFTLVGHNSDRTGDMECGELLGQGGFAAVHHVDIHSPERLRHHSKGKTYAIKHLNTKIYDCTTRSAIFKIESATRKLHLGVKDIVMEAMYLAALQHPNIISLEGISSGGLDAYEENLRTDAYFMVLPRLTCTLADKITDWKYRQRGMHHESLSHTPKTWWPRRGIAPLTEQEQHETRFLCERLQIIIDLCKALEYLHCFRIMHRGTSLHMYISCCIATCTYLDLVETPYTHFITLSILTFSCVDIKPPNIGFDQQGTLKLFDFGLAKEMAAPENSFHAGRGFLLTNMIIKPTASDCMGNTGTTRYMAPEIILQSDYGTKVDVYAASIVCWEVMTLLKPYGNDISGRCVKECVALYDDRPTIPGLCSQHMTPWPKALRKVVQQGWCRDQSTRLTAQEMRRGLEAIVEKKQRRLNLPSSSSSRPASPQRQHHEAIIASMDEQSC